MNNALSAKDKRIKLVKAGFVTLCWMPFAVLIAFWEIFIGTLLALFSISIFIFNPKLAKRLRSHAVAFLLNGIIIPIVIETYPFLGTWFDPQAFTDKQRQHIPILLVHGYGHNSSIWHLFRNRFLRKDPYRLIFTIDLGPIHRCSIEDYAVQLSRKIEEIRTLTGSSEVHLVGHSMGGVVSAYYLCELSESQGIQVRSLVTLGSPLQGTKIASLGIGPCAKGMRLNSPLMQGTADKKKLVERLDEKRLTTQIFHIGTNVDGIIIPMTSSICRLNRKGPILTDKEWMYENVGHVSLVYIPEITERVIQCIQSSERFERDL